MMRRYLCTIILTGLLAASMAACPVTARAFATEPVSASAIDETPVFQAIRDSVTKLETGLHRKVAAVLIDKTSDRSKAGSYDASLQVTVRYWLDYARPEEVPYLKGMQRCLGESKAVATKTWTDWAEAQITLRRSEYADQIAFQQEAKLQVSAVASIDQAGKIVLSTLKVLHALNSSEAISFDAETLALPSEKQSEQAGYDFLKARMTGQGPVSGGAEPPKQSEGQSRRPSQTSPEGRPRSSPQTQLGWNSSRPNEPIVVTGIAVFTSLILLPVISQYLRNRRRS